MKLVQITQELIEAGQSGAGGWNREQLKLLRVPWPPKHGWRQRVAGTWITEIDAAKFVQLKGQTIKEAKRRSRSDKQVDVINLLLTQDATDA